MDGRLDLHAGKHMRICVERKRNTLMSKSLRDDARILGLLANSSVAHVWRKSYGRIRGRPAARRIFTK